MDGVPRRARRLRTLGVVAAALVLSLLAGEVLVRLWSHRDDTGQRWVGNLRLIPYQLPQAQIRTTLERLQDGDTFLAYDAELGWAPRPNAQSESGPFRVNGAGIRSDAETSLATPPGVLRIALFGDSFTFGDEVGAGDTWGAKLERALVERGVKAEVLNFGVNAYGMDQAYLRWQRDGRRYHPAIVIYGFQPENVLRNLNVFRPLYFASTEVPLAKPRFVIRDGALALHDVPTIPPGEMADVLAALPNHPLIADERYFAPWYAPRWWLHSEAVALLETLVVTRDGALFRIDDEGQELAVRLAGEFARDVEAHRAAFLVLHLPRKQDLRTMRAGSEPWYGALAHALADRFAMVDPTRGLVAIDDTLFEPRGHYAAALNQMIGEALVEPVLQAAHRDRPATAAGTKTRGARRGVLPH